MWAHDNLPLFKQSKVVIIKQLLGSHCQLNLHGNYPNVAHKTAIKKYNIQRLMYMVESCYFLYMSSIWKYFSYM